jgi:UBX domain-containing protein 7
LPISTARKYTLDRKSAAKNYTPATVKMADDPVAQFMSITGANATVAAGCLGMTENDVMAAVNLFFENPEIANSFSASNSSAVPGGSSNAHTSRAQGTSSSSRNLGREDDRGVIHIDDDDDDEPIQIDDDDDDMNDLQRIAQESDDAAMARRLQEEMYGQGSGGAIGADDVRAPIARTTETLVGPGGYGTAIDDDGFGGLEQLRRQARPRREFPAVS